jgi:hypothetical protein
MVLTHVNEMHMNTGGMQNTVQMAYFKNATFWYNPLLNAEPFWPTMIQYAALAKSLYVSQWYWK